MKNRKLRIAQVGSLWEQIPPPLYGGTERIISYLTEGLVARGHDVTLFACGTSQTSAELVSVYPRPLFRDGIPATNIMYPLLNLAEVFDRADNFDIIHVHLNRASDYLALPLAARYSSKTVISAHFPYPTSHNQPDRHTVLQKYRHLNFTSISYAQRKGGENLNWIANIYNGIDLKAYQPHQDISDYFVWIGRFNPYKGAREAIQAAKAAGAKLILAGRPDSPAPEERKYYEEEIVPLLDNSHIRAVGELTDTEKNTYLGQAIAYLNPIQWNEPFGLTMAEALACGTPVIAYANGAAPEIIEDGKTGFLVHNKEEMVQRMAEIKTISRQACRQRAEKHFSAETMTENYLAVYDQLTGSR